MLYRILLPLLLAALQLPAQIGSPQYPPGGGYPGGTGYPGGRGGMGGPSLPLPGRKKKTNGKVDEEKVLVEGLRGMLRKLDEKQIVMQADDKRFVTVSRGEQTKFLKAAKEAKLSEFPLGVHVWVEAYRDDDGLYHALRVNWEKAPTDEDRRVAAGPLPQSVQFEDDGSAKPQQKQQQQQAKAGGSATADQPAAAPAPAPQQQQQPAKAAAEETAEVRERATLVVDKVDLEPVPTVRRGRPAAQQRRRDADEPDDAPAPAIRAGGSAAAASTGSLAGSSATEAPVESASNRMPAPAVSEAPKLDPLIEKAREIAFEFSETLPNYLAKQVTTRYVGEGKKDRWTPQDNFTADVVYQDGKESYRNVMLNGKAAKGKIEQTGAWSRGEFGTTLRDVLSPATNATFKPRGTTSINTRRARLFDFTVEQENSHWQIGVTGQTYFPAYRGSIWIDIETARVLRIEMQGRRIPQDFPIETVESAVEWDFVKIGGGNYLVPTHAESLSCMRSMNACSKNVMDFRNYRKFGAESELIFNQD